MLLTMALVTFTGASAQEGANDCKVIANEDSCSTESIQPVIDACLLLAESVEAGDTIAIRKAKELLDSCEIDDFGTLRRQNKEREESLDGHLIFSAAFADSLASGKDAYGNAEHINKMRAKRSPMRPDATMMKMGFIKANSKSVYTFVTNDQQELAMVAEPGGRITTRVHVENRGKGVNEWHNDTTDVFKGRNYRKTSFSLPHSPNSRVTIEITNCTNKDITVVIISN